jgi:hypothetical protein
MLAIATKWQVTVKKKNPVRLLPLRVTAAERLTCRGNLRDHTTVMAMYIYLELRRNLLAGIPIRSHRVQVSQQPSAETVERKLTAYRSDGIIPPALVLIHNPSAGTALDSKDLTAFQSYLDRAAT